jgi:hypothetical protein
METTGEGPGEVSPPDPRYREAITAGFQGVDYDIELVNPELADKLAGILARFPNWHESRETERALRTGLHDALLETGLNSADLVAIANRILDRVRPGAPPPVEPEEPYVDEALTREIAESIEPHQYGSAKRRAWHDNVSGTPEY